SVAWMPPHSEQIVSRICGALFRGSLVVARVDLLCQTTYPGFPQERSLNFYPIAIEAIRKKIEVLVD
ncbi:hypothetical protein BRN33_18825, partial [Xanthomonas oryzae pv. oryzae]